MQPVSQHQKLPVYHLFHELGKIEKASLEQQSNIPIVNVFINWWGKCKHSLRPTFKNPNFKSTDELGKKRENSHNISLTKF